MASISILCIVCLFGVTWCQETVPAIEPTFFRNLVSTWDGHYLTSAEAPIKPLVFSISPSTDYKSVVIKFNSTTIGDARTYTTPTVFGIMFKTDDKDSSFGLVHVEVQRATKGSRVEFYSGFGTPVDPTTTESVQFEHVTSETQPSTWNGTISIPAEYLPRNPTELAAYANFSQSADTKMLVLTLQPGNPKEETAHLPNLYKQRYFETVDLSKHLNKVDLTQWSPLWQKMINVMNNGAHMNSSEHGNASPKNQGIIEQGLTGWIAFAAVSCAILHVFVLSL